MKQTVSAGSICSHEKLVSAGDKCEYTYDSAGRLVKVTGPVGRESPYKYDINGNLEKQMQKVAGTTYDIKRYTYDSRQRMVSEAVLVKTEDILAEYIANGVPDSEYSNMLVCGTYYEYFSTGKIKSRKDAAGKKTSYEYDYDGRVTKKTDPMLKYTNYSYDNTGNLTQEINARSAETAVPYMLSV